MFNPIVLQRYLFKFLSICICGHYKFFFYFSVYLHYYFNGVSHESSLVIFRPTHSSYGLFLAHVFPHFFADVRYKRRQHQDEIFCGLAKKAGIHVVSLLIFVHFVHQFHNGTYGSIEVEPSSDIFLYGEVKRIVQSLVSFCSRFQRRPARLDT